MQIKELIDKSIDILRNIGLVENILNSLYDSEFKPIINFCEENGFKEFDDDLNNLIIKHYYNQLKDGDVFVNSILTSSALEN